MTNLVSKMLHKKKAQEFERDEIARIHQTSRSSFIEVYKVTFGNDVMYLSSSSPEQAKIDYLMQKKYFSMPKDIRGKTGVICNPVPDTAGVTAKLVG